MRIAFGPISFLSAVLCADVAESDALIVMGGDLVHGFGCHGLRWGGRIRSAPSGRRRSSVTRATDPSSPMFQIEGIARGYRQLAERQGEHGAASYR